MPSIPRTFWRLAVAEEKRVYIFTKPLLTLANNIAIKRGYNRAIQPEYIKQQKDGSLWAVVISLLHEHAAGKPVAPHMRCGIYPLTQVDENTMRIEKTDMLFVDTDMDVFDMLPYSVPTKNEKDTPAAVAGDVS